MGWFILVLIAVPLVDLWLLFEISGVIEALPTIALVVFTAVLGGHLVKRQGVSTWKKVQQQMQAGMPPAIELFEGACILVAGALMISPGFITDTAGFLLLIPPLRQAVARWWLQRRLARGAAGHSASHGRTHFEYTAYAEREPQQPEVIDAEAIDAEVIDSQEHRRND